MKVYTLLFKLTPFKKCFSLPPIPFNFSIADVAEFENDLQIRIYHFDGDTTNLQVARTSGLLSLALDVFSERLRLQLLENLHNPPQI